MFYFFNKLGSTIRNIGAERFVADLHSLIPASMSVESTEISMWRVNERDEEVVDIQLLGEIASNSQGDINAGLRAEFNLNVTDNLLTKMVLIARETQLIHLGTPQACRAECKGRLPFCSDRDFQVHLVSRKVNRRYVVSLYRTCRAGDFTIQEMSILRSYAETLMPLVEMHASHRRCELPRRPIPALGGAECSIDNLTIRREFESTLRSAATTLSEREIEVCVGLLSGSTFHELADELGVKSCTIETYIKRAATKLGFKGRHGLVKWMFGES